MANTALVDVLNSSHQLLIQAHSSLLMKTIVLNDVVEEFALGAVLHHEVEL